MADAPKTRAAQFSQILEYMDGPQAVLLERSADYKVVAVAIDKEGFDLPFFGAGISHDQWERYRRGFLDLRYLFMFPRWKDWFVFDLNPDQKGKIRMQITEKDDFAEEHYIPDAGFFAYDHSEPIKSTETEGLATQKYSTDGIWDLPDFSEFYNKVTDIYVFFLSLNKYSAPATPVDQKKRIRDSFADQQYRGGSSYVNLYNGLLSAQGKAERLSVGKLQYASKGEVNVRGRLDIFSEMSVSLANFKENYVTLKEQYQKLHDYLAKMKLLARDPEKFDNKDAISKYILKESNAFAESLALDNVELIYKLTDSHSLRFAKVLLAHYRRLDRYFMFFAEGRIAGSQTEEPVK